MVVEIAVAVDRQNLGRGGGDLIHSRRHDSLVVGAHPPSSSLSNILAAPSQHLEISR